MSATDCTDTELADTREWIVHVCMERHIAAGKTGAQARAIVEEAMIIAFPVWPAHLGRNEHSQPDVGKGRPGIAA